jgi:hypothetical protein
VHCITNKYIHSNKTGNLLSPRIWRMDNWLVIYGHYAQPTGVVTQYYTHKTVAHATQLM